ncbi:MAG: uvrB [Microgenomates bacterium 39_6]|nr:MAG: uvrB [Microgenomates bacterium 39_6]
MTKFKLKSDFSPTGDQPQAIKKLTKGIKQGMKHQVLLGVTGSGKSLAHKEPIFVISDKNEGDKARLIPIGQLIDGLLEKYDSARIGESNVLSAENVKEQYSTLSLNIKTGKYQLQKISEFIRHQSNKNNYLVTTSCGRQIEVTGDHNFWVLRKGQFRLVKTREIKKSDYIPIPLKIKLDEDNKDLEGIWLNKIIDSDTYFTFSRIAPKALKKKNILREVVNYEKYYRALNSNERINTNLLPKIINSWQEVKNLKICLKNGQEIGLYRRLTNTFLCFIGIYIAEGHSTGRYVLISVHEKKFKKIFTDCLNNLGYSFKERNNRPGDFQISHKALSEVLSNWCGPKSKEKRLPCWFMNLSKRQLAIILSAYFSGDGNVTDNEIAVTSVSQELISDISYALLRFGITSRVRIKKKRATNATNMNKRNYFELILSGQNNLRVFYKEIGFLLPKKQKQLKKIVKKESNTNVNVIPVDGKILRKMRLSCRLSQKDIAKVASCSRSHISFIEANKRNPSREKYKKIINLLKSKGVGKKLPSLLNYHEALSQIFWSSVKSIEEVSPSSSYVYDVSVEGNETFLAGQGGLFVHNTFSVAKVIEELQKPALIISHNKTLAGQLYQEFRDFFPGNAISYFVSYYDYYQPEAYLSTTDTYIAKETDINDLVEKLRLEATANVLSRNDVLTVASVSCLYGLGSPKEFKKQVLHLSKGQAISQKEILRQLVAVGYQRNEFDLQRNTFRVRGGQLDIFPSHKDLAVRIVQSNEVVEKISRFDPLTGQVLKEEQDLERAIIYPARHYLVAKSQKEVFAQIRQDLKKQVKKFKKDNRLVEAQRIEERVNYDLEMIEELGYVNGIENYSRYFDGRSPGEPPYTLIDYYNEAYGDDWLLFIDESHMSIPQIRGMYRGDQARKKTLIDFGFRLPAAFDNRPLRFEEFSRKTHQTIYISATPDSWELSLAKTSGQVVEQLIRPTGLPDPKVSIRSTKNQVKDLIREVKLRADKKQRTLVLTLTKRLAEDLADFLAKEGLRVQYLHSEIETLKRSDVLADLRWGKFDCLVGINLLREGLDLPEVSLVAILDADKEGFLRSKTSLIQIMGRAARHVEGEVILYADQETGSIREAVEEINRRRQIQLEYNKKHNITPRSITKPIRDRLIEYQKEDKKLSLWQEEVRKASSLVPLERKKLIKKLRKEMKIAADGLDFEQAIEIREAIKKIV